jgi:hypothetical protein
LGWARDARPWAEAEALWLHYIIPVPEAGQAGGGRLGADDAYVRLVAGIPIWRIWRFVPSALVAGEMNASGAGFHHADLFLGGALAFDTRRFRILGGAGASPLSHSPFFLLKAVYK